MSKWNANVDSLHKMCSFFCLISGFDDQILTVKGVTFFGHWGVDSSTVNSQKFDRYQTISYQQSVMNYHLWPGTLETDYVTL